MKIGASFAEELAQARLAGLPFTWTAEGEFVFGEGITAKQKAAIQAVVAAHDPAKPSIRQAIAELEAKQTPRRVREALAGTDNGWLNDLNTQIAALRTQL